jgi:hypothetical protein
MRRPRRWLAHLQSVIPPGERQRPLPDEEIRRARKVHGGPLLMLVTRLPAGVNAQSGGLMPPARDQDHFQSTWRPKAQTGRSGRSSAIRLHDCRRSHKGVFQRAFQRGRRGRHARCWPPVRRLPFLFAGMFHTRSLCEWRPLVGWAPRDKQAPGLSGLRRELTRTYDKPLFDHLITE